MHASAHPPSFIGRRHPIHPDAVSCALPLPSRSPSHPLPFTDAHNPQSADTSLPHYPQHLQHLDYTIFFTTHTNTHRHQTLSPTPPHPNPEPLPYPRPAPPPLPSSSYPSHQPASPPSPHTISTPSLSQHPRSPSNTPTPLHSPAQNHPRRPPPAFHISTSNPRLHAAAAAPPQKMEQRN